MLEAFVTAVQVCLSSATKHAVTDVYILKIGVEHNQLV